MVTSDLSRLTAEVEIERALVSAGIAVDSGLALGESDLQLLTSNTDEMVTIYSTRDGEPRRILRIDARRTLSQRGANGKPDFWIPEMGGSAPVRIRGAVQCFLDPAFDELAGPSKKDRVWVDSIGLAGRTCNMMNPDKGIPKFLSVFDRDEHMKHIHRREKQTIDAAIVLERQTRLDDDAREAREQQREATAAMLAMAGGSRPSADFACDVEGCEYAGKTARALAIHTGSLHKG